MSKDWREMINGIKDLDEITLEVEFVPQDKCECRQVQSVDWDHQPGSLHYLACRRCGRTFIFNNGQQVDVEVSYNLGGTPITGTTLSISEKPTEA
jgi:hypothetical protein